MYFIKNNISLTLIHSSKVKSLCETEDDMPLPNQVGAILVSLQEHMSKYSNCNTHQCNTNTQKTAELSTPINLGWHTFLLKEIIKKTGLTGHNHYDALQSFFFLHSFVESE